MQYQNTIFLFLCLPISLCQDWQKALRWIVRYGGILLHETKILNSPSLYLECFLCTVSLITKLTALRIFQDLRCY